MKRENRNFRRGRGSEDPTWTSGDLVRIGPNVRGRLRSYLRKKPFGQRETTIKSNRFGPQSLHPRFLLFGKGYGRWRLVHVTGDLG